MPSDQSSAFGYRVPLDPQSPWPKFKRDAAQTGRSPIVPIATDQLPWEYRTELGVFSPAVIDGDENVYIGSGDHTFYCFRKDGTVKWSFRTGELIDSSALLDNKGRVFVPSSDGHVYALDRESGDLIWKFRADTISECHQKGVKSFVDWFEAHVAIDVDGTIVAPNDNFHTYALDPNTGKEKWHFLTSDQTWSSPALDVETRRWFMGMNYFVLRNVFAFDAVNGKGAWKAGSLGSMVASPLLVRAGNRDLVVAAGFDGICRAFSRKSGRLVWKYGARDHFYASPVLGIDGFVIIPAADGTVYALDPTDGRLKWSFDTPEPIRSTPAVDGEGNIYFGNGEGKLYCIDRSGSFRWAYRVVTNNRSDVNSSPALSSQAVVVGGDDGTIVRVPLGYPLSERASGDARCVREAPATPDGALLYTLSTYGKREETPPAAIDANQPIALSLVVREGGAAQTALIDPKSVRVEVSGGTRIDANVSADRRFITIVPVDAWVPAQHEARAVSSAAPMQHEAGGGSVAAPTQHEKGGASVAASGACVPDGRAGQTGARGEPGAGAHPSDAPGTGPFPERGRSLARANPSDASGDGLGPRGGSATDAQGRPAPGARRNTVRVTGSYRVKPHRFGLKMFGGRRGGSFDRTFSFAIEARSGLAFPFTIADGPLTPVSILELGRLAPAMPTILPSYNQLGFDSIHYHLTFLEGNEKRALLWGVGAKLVGGGEERSVVDPSLNIRFAVYLDYDDGLVTLISEEGFTLEFNGWDIPYDLFRVSARFERLDTGGATGATSGAVGAAGTTTVHGRLETARTGSAAPIARAEGRLNAKVRCDDIAFYGPFLKVLGVSDFRTGMMYVSGGAGKVNYLGERRFERAAELGTISWRIATSGSRQVGAAIADSRLRAADHNFGILLVSIETGKPMPLNYTKVTTVEATPDGRVRGVSIELPRNHRDGNYRAYLLIDGLPVERSIVAIGPGAGR